MAKAAPKELYSDEEWMDVKSFIRRRFGKIQQDELAARANEIQATVIRQFYASPMFAIRNFFHTVSKESDLVSLDPWPGQTIHDIAIESQRRRGLPQRVVEIKARQVGFTAWNLARGFHAAMHPRMKVGILVEDEDVAKSLMLRVGEMYNNLPPWMRPMKRIDNPGELVFDNPSSRTRDELPGLNSRIIITVPNSLRGFTPNYFIWSEAAFCKNWEDVSDGVLSGMAANARSCVIIDTTPNGHDEFYKPLVFEAVERNPKWVKAWERKGAPTRAEIIAGALGEPDRPAAGYVPSFCPWHWHPEYTTKNEEPVHGALAKIDAKELQHVKATLGTIEKYGDEEEIELVERFGVSLYRIAWRRWKLDNDTMGADHWERLLTFRQEYMTTWDSGFITFGRGAFDAKGLDVIYRQHGRYGVRDPIVTGGLRRDPQNGKIYCSRLDASDYLSVCIWAMPEPGEQYVIGIDTSQAYNSLDADANVAQVIRRRDRKQVAKIKARIPPHELRDQCVLLYQLYNNPYTGVEVEGAGYDLVNQLWERGCRNQYFYRRFDQPSEEPATKYLGWETNDKTRNRAQRILVEAIGRRDETGKPDPDIVVCDRETMQELMDVTRDPYGKIANHSGGHDDHFMALMIALAIDEDPWNVYQAPRERVQRQELNALVRRLGLSGVSSDRNHPDYSEL